MSDARDIVQPRWKRRATEIAEAIGGGGTSSVSLDSNTITLLSQAIADAIDLKVLDVNIMKYDGNFTSGAGIPVRSGYGDISGVNLLKVRSIDETVDVNVKQFNDADVDSRGLPVQAGRTVGTNVLTPLIVNCQTTNNFPTGSGGTVTFPSEMDVNLVRLGKYTNGTYGPRLSPSIDLSITGNVNCTQNTGSVRPWIVTTGVQGSNTLGQWGDTTLATTETAPLDVETAMDNALANATGISVTETNPVSGGGSGTTTVNFPSTMAVTGTVSVDNHPTPVSVQDVKVVGDETTGIIMSKNFYTGSGVSDKDYYSIGMGLGTYAGYTNKQGITPNMNSPASYGWTIRVNGADVYNQDISTGLRGTNPTPASTLPQSFSQSASAFPLYIHIDSQATVDKYHGRKVTLSSVANVWIIEPIDVTAVISSRIGVVYSTDNSNGTDRWSIFTQDGSRISNQVVYNNRVRQYNNTTTSEINAIVGLRVVYSAELNRWTTIET